MSSSSELFGDDIKKLWPIILRRQRHRLFDNCLELLVLGGYSLPHA
jgi:glutamate synthase (NADPH) large chain